MSPGGSIAWNNRLYRFGAIAGIVVLILLSTYHHEYGLPNVSLPPLPSFDAFPSLPFFKSSNNSSLFKYPPFAAHPLSKSRRRSRYSTHNCMGGQDLPGLNFDDQTTCEFKDVCVSLLPLWSEKELAEMNETERRVATTLRLEYFRPEGVGDDVPIQWNNEFPVGELDVLSSEAERAGRSWTRLDRDSAVIPVIVKGEIPPNERWSDAKIAVLTEAFYPENFGHALGDDFFAVYRLVRHFYASWTAIRRSLQVIFHPGCLGRAWEERGCSHHLEISATLLDHPLTTKDDTEFWRAKDGNDRVCFENLIIGTRSLGMQLPSGGGIWREFIRVIKGHYRIDLHHRPPKQKITLLRKVGRRTLTNYEELRDHLEKRFGVEVDIIAPADYPLGDQIRVLRDTTVVVSPCGGVSFSAMFLSEGVSAVFVDYWDTIRNHTAQMERYIFTYQPTLTSFYYPIEFSDLSWDDSKIFPLFLKPEHHALKIRDWTNVTISLERMEKYVLAALLTSEGNMGWEGSFTLPKD